MSTQYAYLITNRAHVLDVFEDRVGKSLTFLRAPAGTADFSIVLYDVWLASLQKDIAQTATGGVGQAMLFVHGYAVDFDKAKALFGDFLDNLGKLGGYPGPVVEFDWPSNGIIALSDLMPGAFSKAKVRAQETGAMFDQLAKVLADMHKTRKLDGASASSVNLSVVCHSMGNYAMQQGAALLPTGADQVVDQMLLVAAMLSTDSFDPAGSVTPGAAVMAATKGAVTAYYTRWDDVLPFASVPVKGLDEYPELGVTGPLYVPVPPQPLYPGFSAMDCTSVVTPQAAKQYGAPKVHEAYFYIPQMVQTIVTAAQAIPPSAAR